MSEADFEPEEPEADDDPVDDAIAAAVASLSARELGAPIAPAEPPVEPAPGEADRPIDVVPIVSCGVPAPDRPAVEVGVGVGVAEVVDGLFIFSSDIGRALLLVCWVPGRALVAVRR